MLEEILVAGRSIRRAAQLGLTCLVLALILGVVGLVSHLGWLTLLAPPVGSLGTLLLFVSGAAWLTTAFLHRHGAEDDSPEHD